MSDFDVSFFENFDKNPIKIRVQEQKQDKVLKTVKLCDGITAVYKTENPENQETEEQISTAPENPEDSTLKFRCESKTRAEKDKQEKTNKLFKTGGILILCLLLVNFVLIVIAMNRKSELSASSSSPFSTREFSAWVNQTDETAQILGEMKFGLDEIEKRRNSTEEKFKEHHFQIGELQNRTKIGKELEALEKEKGELKRSHGELTKQFESLSQKVDQLEKNISLNRNVSLVTPAPAENETRVTPAPQQKTARSCSDAMEAFLSPRSEKQVIYPHGNNNSAGLEVVCDFETDGGGWTIIQKRSSGPKQEFSQNWTEYSNGFGSLDKNFWLGLENIRALTKNGDQELRIELEDQEGEKRYAKYSSFSVSDAADFYRLAISGFSGTAGDSMTNPNYPSDLNNGMRFSTKDQDNDNYPGFDCVAGRGGGGGWWFNGCGLSNLNGLYFEKGETVPFDQGIYWWLWTGNYYSLAKTEMKIRTRK